LALTAVELLLDEAVLLVVNRIVVDGMVIDVGADIVEEAYRVDLGGLVDSGPPAALALARLNLSSTEISR
jgi:hypothetical protein